MEEENSKCNLTSALIMMGLVYDSESHPSKSSYILVKFEMMNNYFLHKACNRQEFGETDDMQHIQ